MQSVPIKLCYRIYKSVSQLSIKNLGRYRLLRLWYTRSYFSLVLRYCYQVQKKNIAIQRYRVRKTDKTLIVDDLSLWVIYFCTKIQHVNSYI